MNSQKKEMNFWLKGKLEQKKFYDIKLKTKTNLITFIFGLIMAAILLLPLGILVFQFLVIYGYDSSIFIAYLTVVWVLLMLFNGLSNYFTVKLAQAYVKDMINLQDINAKYIFLYQILNFGFGIVSLFIIVFFGMQMIGAL